MTSRLKRKLNDLGVDPSSSKANESFCLIGTPLPPLEKSKDTGEFVPLWKQEVRDEKGRRRLHGAFTGGFSAGYFNTVGSKEGWAPATFVSSRSDRAKKQKARPEDFMDEEDLAEIQESRQLVDENEEMDFGGTKSELQTEDDSVANALAASLAPPVKDSVGARILKKMGWRIGQGIGPRITLEQRRTQDRLHGIPTEDVEDEEAKKHMYPRRDTPLLIVPRKDNSHGLGYTPGMGLNESLGAGGSRDAKGSKLSAGFGLGALNDADEDDLDVYDGSLNVRGGRRMAYDAEDDDDRITMGTSKSGRSRPSQSMRAPGITQTFRDGTPVLKGFVLSDQPVAEDRWFPIPEVPKGWKPNPRRVWERETNKENIPSSKGKEREGPPKTRAEWKSSLLTADERGSMLGETPLPAQARSVFDYMSQKDRERLENIKGNINVPRLPPPPPPDPEPTPGLSRTEISMPQLHPSVAKAALSGFQPFTTDPVKQSRYTAFLQFASQDASQQQQLSIGPTPGQSIGEFNKELSDYSKAATVFKPLSGAMAGRFRSAIIVENGPKIIEGLHTPDLSETKEEEVTKEEEEEDPRMGAIRLGMYGPLTREVVPWQPARLLCKRFGVKEPEIEEPDPATVKPDLGDAVPPGPTGSAPLAITDGSADDTGAASESKPGVRNLASIGLGEDETQGQDTLTYKRPAMDIFKAIFASDDEDSDDEDTAADNLEPKPSTVPSDPPVEVSVKDEPLPSILPSKVVEPTKPPVDEKVDLATFKPTFIPRTERDSRTKDKDREKDKKKKKKVKTLISFDDNEEDGGLQLNVKPQKRKDGEKLKDKDGERKKKKRKETKAEEEDDGMWVEKPAPEAVQNITFTTQTSSETPQDGISEGIAGPPRGRKRAVDFM
ncbi:hypothetical protein BDW22DRAFT_1407187 [Trametopsis cervina]|nr:hypothetical protein BDW22DRAFT_1407187 [Trametopsis cervina]